MLLSFPRRFLVISWLLLCATKSVQPVFPWLLCSRAGVYITRPYSPTLPLISTLIVHTLFFGSNWSWTDAGRPSLSIETLYQLPLGTWTPTIPFHAPRLPFHGLALVVLRRHRRMAITHPAENPMLFVHPFSTLHSSWDLGTIVPSLIGCSTTLLKRKTKRYVAIFL